MHRGDRLPTLRGAEPRQRLLRRLDLREDLLEAVRHRLAVRVEAKRNRRLGDESVALGHLEPLQPLVVGRTKERVLLHAELLVGRRRDAVEVAPHRVALDRERFAHAFHGEGLLDEHRTVRDLPKDLDLRQADREGVVERARLAEPVEFGGRPRIHERDAIEVRELGDAGVLGHRDPRAEPLLAKVRRHRVLAVGKAQHEPFLDLLHRGAERRVRRGPRGDLRPVRHARPDGGLVELGADRHGRRRRRRERVEERTPAAVALGDAGEGLVELLEKRRVVGDRARGRHEGDEGEGGEEDRTGRSRDHGALRDASGLEPGVVAGVPTRSATKGRNVADMLRGPVRDASLTYDRGFARRRPRRPLPATVAGNERSDPRVGPTSSSGLDGAPA